MRLIAGKYSISFPPLTFLQAKYIMMISEKILQLLEFNRQKRRCRQVQLVK